MNPAPHHINRLLETLAIGDFLPVGADHVLCKAFRWDEVHYIPGVPEALGTVSADGDAFDTGNSWYNLYLGKTHVTAAHIAALRLILAAAPAELPRGPAIVLEIT